MNIKLCNIPSNIGVKFVLLKSKSKTQVVYQKKK